MSSFRVLGLRLVKKTVNFDNHHVFHFYYGDERGTPGTIWTTFPYKNQGVRVGTKGAGQVTSTHFSVPKGTLSEWRSRISERGIVVNDEAPRFGEAAISCVDPSGLVFELIETERDNRTPWMGSDVGPELAIHGIHSVGFTVHSPKETVDFLVGFLGFEVGGEDANRTRLMINGGNPGRAIDVIHKQDAPPAINGLGTVHHVALAVADAEEQLRIREALVTRGHKVTPVMDRQYFTSIYFREPGGVLLEIATAGPGFLIDEEIGALGRLLKLPPWEEPDRPAIEAGLPKVRY